MILIVGLWQAGCDKEPPPADAKPTVQHVKIEAKRISVVYPKDTAIPDAFINASFNNMASDPHGPYLPDCMIAEKADATCDMAVIDLNRDNKPEIVVLSGNELIVYIRGNSDYEWMSMSVRTVDEKTITAFKAGQIFSLEPHYDDLGLGTKLIDVSDGSVGKGYWEIAQAKKAEQDTPPPRP